MILSLDRTIGTGSQTRAGGDPGRDEWRAIFARRVNLRSAAIKPIERDEGEPCAASDVVASLNLLCCRFDPPTHVRAPTPRVTMSCWHCTPRLSRRALRIWSHAPHRSQPEVTGLFSQFGRIIECRVLMDARCVHRRPWMMPRATSVRLAPPKQIPCRPSSSRHLGAPSRTSWFGCTRWFGSLNHCLRSTVSHACLLF